MPSYEVKKLFHALFLALLIHFSLKQQKMSIYDAEMIR